MQEYLSLISIIILLVTAIIFIRMPLLATFFSLPYQAIIRLLTFLKITKNDSHWSVVYDARTKLPIDPAYVTVKNLVGVEIASMITDLNGRFSLILPRGLYVIDVQKTNYLFPSESLKHAHSDGKYDGLYYGETIEVNDTERAIAVTIPMDPIGSDWNQKEKQRNYIFFHFGNETSYKGTEIFYWLIGAALALYLYTHSPSNYFFLLLVGYLAVLCAIMLWRLFEPSQYTHSVMINKKTKQPLAFARVTIFTAGQHTQVMRKISSFEGQFTALLSSGKYYLTIERRDDHGGYAIVFTSPVFRVHDGYIGKRFTV